MKEKILKMLLEGTTTESRYIGGGEGPSIIVFKFSEDCDREIFLAQIAEEIEKDLKVNPCK